MKKVIAVFLSLCMLLSIAGCKDADKQKETVTLRVLATTYMEDDAEWYEDLCNWVYPGKNIKLEFEFLPVHYKEDHAEYESMLSRIRTEIMAGEGPDVFILPTWEVGKGWDEAGNEVPMREPFFKDVDEAMNNRIFYPLDELMENSEDFNIEDHEDIIMEAGRVGEEQFVLPILYSIQFSLVDKALMQNPEISFKNFEDFVNCEDKALIGSTQSMLYNWVHLAVPEYADYDNGELLVSPESLAATFKLAADFKPDNGILYDMQFGFNEDVLYSWNSSDGAAYPLCVPNTEGGLTAEITAYAAINANTEHPEEAFELIQIIFSDEFQTNRGFEVEGYDYRLCSGWCPKGWMFTNNWQNGLATGKKAYRDDVLYDREALDSIISRISHVRFTSEFDSMISDAWYELSVERRGEELTDSEYEEAAEELYKKMLMALNE